MPAAPRGGLSDNTLTSEAFEKGEQQKRSRKKFTLLHKLLQISQFKGRKIFACHPKNPNI